ncbi:MAG: cobyrinic acid a,c-diamide synthase [Mycobacteriales bacterium]
MSRRTSLPGAAELFRATGGLAGSTAAAESEPLDDLDPGASRTGEPAELSVSPGGLGPVIAPAPAPDDLQARRATTVRRTARRRSSSADKSPSGRERHEEKITVYCSADELLDLESARLALRADHGLAVDRGRIVREALAVVLADLEAKGESSVLVRRLTGR